MDERKLIERWMQHFDEHLNGVKSACNKTTNVKITTSYLREIEDTIQQLKNSNAAEKDGIVERG